MPNSATPRQKQFLRQLGHKDVGGLTKEAASALIDRLLAEEKGSGRTFPCPYCKKQFGPRPTRTKKCPSCGQTIVHLSGKFYTEQQVNELDQKEWLQESRKDNRTNVMDDWRDERDSRKEFGDSVTVGYLIHVGTSCQHAKHLDGLLVLIEDAVKSPDLLPPFDECRHGSCECDFEAVSKEQVPKGTRIAEWVGGSREPRSAVNETKKGCLSVVLLIAACMLPVAAVLIYVAI